MVKKIVCFVTPRFPYPENGGDVVLLNDLMRYFKSIGYSVLDLTYYEEDQKELIKKKYSNIDKIYPIKRFGIKSVFYALRFFVSGKPIQCGYYYSEDMVRELKTIEEGIHPDLYVCHLIRMVPIFLKAGIKNNVIVQMSDVLSKTYILSKKSKGSLAKRLIYSVEQKPVEKYEHFIANTFNKVVLVSQKDCNYFGNNPHIYYHNNGIRSIEKTEQIDKNKIVFVGNMRTLQNVDGCLYFANEIFPQILKQKPSMRLHIVGASPSKKVLELQSDNVIVTGFVDSIQDYIKDAVVSVAPIRVAAGIQNKVLISMASNVPVVMSSLIADGIPETINDFNCVIEDNPKKFADKCIQIIENDEYRREITGHATELVKNHYFWNIHLEGYEKWR